MNEIEICTINGVKWVLGDAAPERMNWQDAVEWCESIGQQLPPRVVLLMAYLNPNPEIRGSFANNYYYWSSTEYDSNGAWGQDFSFGNQYYSSKGNSLPVMAVRAIKGLTPREGLAEYKKGYARAELDLNREQATLKLHGSMAMETFNEGIEYAAKHHGIGGEE